RKLGDASVDLELDPGAPRRRTPPSKREERVEYGPEEGREEADQEPCTSWPCGTRIIDHSELFEVRSAHPTSGGPTVREPPGPTVYRAFPLRTSTRTVPSGCVTVIDAALACVAFVPM